MKTSLYQTNVEGSETAVLTNYMLPDGSRLQMPAFSMLI